MGKVVSLSGTIKAKGAASGKVGRIVGLSGSIKGKTEVSHGAGDDGSSAFALKVAAALKEKADSCYAAAVTLGNAATDWEHKGNQRLEAELEASLDNNEPGESE